MSLLKSILLECGLSLANLAMEDNGGGPFGAAGPPAEDAPGGGPEDVGTPFPDPFPGLLFPLFPLLPLLLLRRF